MTDVRATILADVEAARGECQDCDHAIHVGPCAEECEVGEGFPNAAGYGASIWGPCGCETAHPATQRLTALGFSPGQKGDWATAVAVAELRCRMESKRTPRCAIDRPVCQACTLQAQLAALMEEA